MIITITLLVLIVLGFILYKNGVFVNNKNQDTSVFVRDFIEMMIPHHEEAVKVSLTVMNDLDITEPKVRVLAANIVDNQSFEINQLKNIHAEFLGGEYMMSSSTENHMMRDYTNMKGDDLAKTYIEDMIKHHEEAVKVAEKYVKLIDKVRKASSSSEGGLIVTNSHPSIDMTYDMAKGIIESQAKEIELMKSLY